MSHACKLIVQDQTYKKPVVTHLGKDEKSHGLSYTVLSRATRPNLIGVAGSMAGNRFTSKIGADQNFRKGREKTGD